MRGTVVENSLRDKSILKRLDIVRTWQADDWTLHEVNISMAEALKLAARLHEGPWYAHFWKEGSDDIVVVFKDKVFTIRASDKGTWADCIKYGSSLGIPAEQLDFKKSV